MTKKASKAEKPDVDAPVAEEQVKVADAKAGLVPAPHVIALPTIPMDSPHWHYKGGKLTWHFEGTKGTMKGKPLASTTLDLSDLKGPGLVTALGTFGYAWFGDKAGATRGLGDAEGCQAKLDDAMNAIRAGVVRVKGAVFEPDEVTAEVMVVVASTGAGKRVEAFATEQGLSLKGRAARAKATFAWSSADPIGQKVRAIAEARIAERAASEEDGLAALIAAHEESPKGE